MITITIKITIKITITPPYHKNTLYHELEELFGGPAESKKRLKRMWGVVFPLS